jgi:hypothetical protein
MNAKPSTSRQLLKEIAPSAAVTQCCESERRVPLTARKVLEYRRDELEFAVDRWENSLRIRRSMPDMDSLELRQRRAREIMQCFA